MLATAAERGSVTAMRALLVEVERDGKPEKAGSVIDELAKRRTS
jgi:hypothetical protein